MFRAIPLTILFLHLIHGSNVEIGRNKYVGEWKDGYKHGVGVMRTPQGDVWVGQWRYNNWLGGKQYGKKEVPPHIMTLFVKN